MPVPERMVAVTNVPGWTNPDNDGVGNWWLIETKPPKQVQSERVGMDGKPETFTHRKRGEYLRKGGENYDEGAVFVFRSMEAAEELIAKLRAGEPVKKAGEPLPSETARPLQAPPAVEEEASKRGRPKVAAK